jgi:hypothetical protein
MPQNLNFFGGTLLLTLFLIQCKTRNFNVESDTARKNFAGTLKKFRPPDLAILFPLVDRWEDFVRLLGLGWDDSGDEQKSYRLISEIHFNQIVREGHLSLNHQGDVGAYSRNERTLTLIQNSDRWKVVSVRYSPCVKANPKAKQIDCHPELRLIAQPLFESKEAFREGTIATPSDYNQGTQFGRGLSTKSHSTPSELVPYKRENFLISEDQALHLIYKLSAKDNADFLKSLVELKQSSDQITLKNGTKVSELWKDQTGKTEKIWVHPLLYASFKEISNSFQLNADLRLAEEAFKLSIMKNARGIDHPINGPANLKQALFLGTGVRTAGTGWAFSSYFTENNETKMSLRRAPLNAHPSQELLDNFKSDPEGIKRAQQAQILFHHYHGITQSMTTPFGQPALSDDIISLTDRFGVIENQKEEFEKRAWRLMDPQEHSQSERNCGNCHTATSTVLNFHRNRLESLTEKQKQSPGYAALGHYPMFFGFNLRQFGYYTSFPSISLRTQTEAWNDAEFVSQNAENLAQEINISTRP